MKASFGEKRLDFFIVGAQKAGTTALAAKLGRHPAISCSSPKELHLFDDDSLDWYTRPVSDLAKHFSGSSPDALWGEATPIYMYWPKAIERLAAYNPAAKIIVSLRHPAYRAASHWKMETARKAETLTFAEAISAAGRSRVAPVHRVYSYVERGFYAWQIARILAHFPRQNVFFIRMEDLYLNEGAVLPEIHRFLEVPAAQLDQGSRYVVSVDSSAVKLDATEHMAELTALYHSDILETARLTGLDLRAWTDSTYDESYLLGARLQPGQRQSAT